jgi:hypothetical protein
MNRREFAKTTLLGGIALVRGNGLTALEKDSRSQVGLDPASDIESISPPLQGIRQSNAKSPTTPQAKFIGAVGI